MPTLTGFWSGSDFPPPPRRPRFQLKKNPHKASLWVQRSLVDVPPCFCAKHSFWNYGQEVQLWFHQNIFSQNPFGRLQMCFRKIKPGFIVFLGRRRLPSCNSTPQPRRMRNMGDSCHMYDTDRTCQKFLQPSASWQPPGPASFSSSRRLQRNVQFSATSMLRHIFSL